MRISDGMQLTTFFEESGTSRDNSSGSGASLLSIDSISKLPDLIVGSMKKTCAGYKLCFPGPPHAWTLPLVVLDLRGCRSESMVMVKKFSG